MARLDLQLHVDLSDVFAALHILIVPAGFKEFEPCTAGSRLYPGGRRQVREMEIKVGPKGLFEVDIQTLYEFIDPRRHKFAGVNKDPLESASVASKSRHNSSRFTICPREQT